MQTLILMKKILLIFSVPYVDVDVDIQPIAIVPADLPSGMDITAPFFRGITPYRNYSLFDEVMRQSDRLNEREKIKWIIKWSQSKGYKQC